MGTLFQQVAKIARRGRKRWLGMVFISQLPQHLPDEVLGLINNWILHKISDANVITRLKKSVGGIDDSLWNRLVSLAQGQAVASFTSFTRPLQVNIDPARCKLLMVD
jgi:DNA helicase HerA-like ATPase